MVGMQDTYITLQVYTGLHAITSGALFKSSTWFSPVEEQRSRSASTCYLKLIQPTAVLLYRLVHAYSPFHNYLLHPLLPEMTNCWYFSCFYYHWPLLLCQIGSFGLPLETLKPGALPIDELYTLVLWNFTSEFNFGSQWSYKILFILIMVTVGTITV